MYFTRERIGPVEVAFTDREGGVSRAPYDSLNLAVSSDDAAEDVHRNHELLLSDFAGGADLADMSQVHGNVVRAADPAVRPECDALVTDRSDLVLLVRVADCVPVVLADAEAGVVAVAHSGRPGLAAGVVPATIRRMEELGARPARTTAWIGPHVCGGCYEVPEELRAEVAAVEPAAWATTTWGTPALDIGAGVRAQLERVGVDVRDRSACTRERTDLFSYRRDGAGAGRLAGLVRRHAA
ncbi:laccase domain protein [Marmoricola endophyticus]|uniref:Purine nucleoside phosphorylase n=1 Tax=Marmoricola endophyticus TaxID=2040280 RepID=A0A917F2Y2_9ACTN|nr:peptidoglycan editing factor PgeF [Marmoricola endophyticus]GGF37917.1 laccase domain protein [Marmoricola endophyticus]